MVKRKLYFVELLEVSAGWLLYLKRVGFRWPKSALLNILIVVVSLSLIVTNGNKSNNGAVINPSMTMADMGSYPDNPAYSSFIAAITLPANGSMFVAPANITIYASAINIRGSVVKLDFYADDSMLYSSKYANYAFTWRDVPAGQYVLAVIATNYKGATTTSLPVNITVIDPTATGCTCPAGCGDRTDISPPFSIDGEGEYCWETTSLGRYVYSMNMDMLSINGADLKNCWTNKLPYKIGGKYFIYYKSSDKWGHFEMK